MAVSADLVDRVLRTAVAVALDHHAAYDRLDGVAGDGDFGSTLVRGAGALAAAPPSGSAADRLREAGRLASDAMGGSSGAFTGVALVRAASAVDEGAAAALAAAVAGIHEYGGAEPGDKTLIDALAPLADALGDDPGDVAAAVAAARAGADATAGMQARRGRASYAGGDVQEATDPGATAVADIAEAVASGQEPPSWADLHARAERLDTGDDEDAGPRRGLIGHPTALVGIALDGLAGAHPRLLRRLEDAQVVVGHAIADGPRRVAVVSGGGAGHEPLHAGFVGEGMLDAAVPGAVFTSPAPGQILAAARAVHRGAGVLFVVKRYTGDVLNFRLARELAAAEDIVVETVIVADDVAIPADAPTGRRGTGTTIAVERSPAPPPRAATRSTPWPRSPSARPMPVAPTASPSTARRSRSASASTASRAADASRCPRPRASPSCCSSPCWPRSTRRRRCWCCCPAWAARRSCSSARCTSTWPRACATAT
jgi:dihydroxyacetone kinase